MKKCIPVNSLRYIQYADGFGASNPRNRAAYVIIGREVIFTETNDGGTGFRQSVKDRTEEVIRAILANEKGLDGRDCRFFDLVLGANFRFEEVVPIWAPDCIRPVSVERKPAKCDVEKIMFRFAALIESTKQRPAPVLISVPIMPHLIGIMRDEAYARGARLPVGMFLDARAV